MPGYMNLSIFGRYDVAMHSDTSFLQTSCRKNLEQSLPNPKPIIEMIETIAKG